MNTDQLRAHLLERARQAPTPPAELAEHLLQRRRASRGRRAGVVGVALAILLVVAGLPFVLSGLRSADSDTAGEENPVSNVADLATRTFPPGTALSDGFVVAANSELVGAVFPLVNSRSTEARPLSGWTGQLLVSRDPIGVFNDYVRQAGDLGYEMQGGCQVRGTAINPVSLADYQGDGAELVGCQAYYDWSSDRTPPDSTYVAVQLSIGEIVPGYPAATATLYFGQVGDGSGDPGEYQYGPPLSEITDPLPTLPQVAVPALPTAGEPIAPLLSQRADFLVVPPGSTLAALPTIGARCTWEAILLTADLDGS